jgi:hypothetical protein
MKTAEPQNPCRGSGGSSPGSSPGRVMWKLRWEKWQNISVSLTKSNPTNFFIFINRPIIDAIVSIIPASLSNKQTNIARVVNFFKAFSKSHQISVLGWGLYYDITMND